MAASRIKIPPANIAAGGKKYLLFFIVLLTGSTPLELILNLRRWNIKTLRYWKEVVEISMDIMLSPEQYDLVQLVYWKRMPLDKIYEEKAINKNTLNKQRRDIMKLLAWCFGFIKNEDALKKIRGLITYG